MKLKLLAIAIFAVTSTSWAQNGRDHWKATSPKLGSEIVENKTTIKSPQLFELDLVRLQKIVTEAPSRHSKTNSDVVMSFPTAEGQFEDFTILKFSNMDPELAARYPEIQSFVGKGIDDPTSMIYFSISPLGLQAMTIKSDRSATFIEPFTQDGSAYVVFKKSDKTASLDKFECKVIGLAQHDLELGGEHLRPNADDGKLRNYRLAMSVTGEYTAYFGGTKALALAAINNTMTRVNAIFEMDFGVHMNLIANNDLVIYANASSDPYSAASTGAGGAWNQELQTTLTNVIGSANYDIGHLFGASGGGGNAGCIGCVCKNPTSSAPLGKGSGYTSPYDGIPQGDNFDIDYVAHEIGHQFGANHTFTHSNEGTGKQMEPGSGSTIMGYAGITGATNDVQPHSDSYFHAISIEQVTNYIKTTTCQTTVTTGNAVPTANAGIDRTIPKGTPFMLTGSATDGNNDILTYAWEQMNVGTPTSTIPSATRTSGPAFRSIPQTTSPTRYFPRLSTVQSGATSWKWEVMPTVARTMNFRLTVRDNRAGGPANNSDDIIITVNGTAGPFTVSAPNTAVTWAGGSTQTVTWNVAGTTANGVNAANVDILLSTDGGNTFTTMLLASTPNDGSQSVTIPNLPGSQNRIIVKGTNHIFYDMSNANFTITAGSSDTTAPTAPTNLAASGTTQSSTNLTWTASSDNVGVTGYDVYQNGSFRATVATNSYAVTGLTASTTYSFYVRAKDAAGNISSNSNTASVTTLAAGISYCTSQGNSVADERIGRVLFAGIDNSAATSSGYSDFTSLSAAVNRGTAYTITITPSWTGSTYSEGYAVFIDYNRDGDFTDAGETVWTLSASTASPVNGTFTIPATAALGTTRMRVSMKYNGVPTACEAFSYGEVEDYSVNISGGTADTQAPSVPTNLSASGTTQTTTNLSWSASTDNVGVTAYDVYQGAALKATVSATSYNITGLTSATTYSFTVRAKDAAGNISGVSNSASVITLSASVNYCSSQGNNTADERIGRVVLGSINNPSTGTAGYENFTSISTNLVRGISNTITITPFWSGTKYNEGYAVFIDYNGDGDFTDAGETVYTRAASQTTPVSGSFTVPSGTTLGSKRMRVSMKYNGIPTSCEV
nr:fibronectin type III domain-containing protein [Flavobacterium sp.]